MRRILIAVALIAPLLAVGPSGADALGTGTITGTVTDGSVAVAGVTVSACRYTFTGCPVVGTAVTDINGDYTIGSLDTAGYFVRFDPPADRQDLGFVYYNGGFTGTQFVPSDMLSVADGTTSTANITLPAGGRIRGVVTLADGSAAVGASVVARLTDGPMTSITSVTTGAGGAYELAHLPAWTGRVGTVSPGRYLLTVNPPFGSLALQTTVPQGGDSFTITTGADIVANVSLNAGIYGTAQLSSGGTNVAAALPWVTAAMCPAPSAYTGAGYSCSPSGALVQPYPGGTAGLGSAGQVLLLPAAAGSYTIRAVDASAFPSVALGPLTSLDLTYGDVFACTLPLDTGTASCAVTSSSAPVTVPDPAGGSITIGTPDGGIGAVSVTDPSSTPAPPSGVSFGSSVISYSVTVPPAGSATVTITVPDAGGTLNTAWKLIGDTWFDAAPLGPVFTPNGNGTTSVTLTITDNGFGDVDPTSGVIRDPIAFSSAARYTFGGFRPPIDAAPTVNVVRAGSTVPVKWRLLDADGHPVSDPSSFVSLTLATTSCSTTAPTDALEYTLLSTSTLQYLGAGVWQSNWKTAKGATGCGTLTLTLADGSTHDALFRFR